MKKINNGVVVGGDVVRKGAEFLNNTLVVEHINF